MPMYDRVYFSNRELSLIDNNYPLLNQYLRGTLQDNLNQTDFALEENIEETINLMDDLEDQMNQIAQQQ